MILFAAVCVFLASAVATFVYVWLQAVAGRFFGAVVERVSLGIGPILWTRTVNETQWCVSALPFGGYTKFFGQEAEETAVADERTRFHELSIAGRLCVMLIGPISNLLLGAGLMAIPVITHAPQMTIEDPAELIDLTSIPNLGFAKEASTAQRQTKLICDAVTAFWKQVQLFRQQKPWGGPIGLMITAGEAGQKHVEGWCSCCGMLLVFFGAWNLLPLPTLNGWHIVLLLFETVHLKLPQRVIDPLNIIGILFALIVLIATVVLDIRWLWHFGGVIGP